MTKIMMIVSIKTNQTDGSRECPFIPLDPFCVCSSKIIGMMMLIIIVKIMMIGVVMMMIVKIMIMIMMMIYKPTYSPTTITEGWAGPSMYKCSQKNVLILMIGYVFAQSSAVDVDEEKGHF